MTSISKMDKLPNQIGYLVLQDDGAVIESGGELENDERSANIFMNLFHLTESVDDNFMPNNSCERISLAYDDYTYNISMSNRRIYIVKLKNITNRVVPFGVSTNGTSVVYAEPDNLGTTSILA